MRTAYVLRHRLRTIGWFREQLAANPGGLVPVGTAARILGVTKQRMGELVREGRIPVVEDCPTGSRVDRFVPLDALLSAPTALEAGRPLIMDVDNRIKRDGPKPPIVKPDEENFRGDIGDPSRV